MIRVSFDFDGSIGHKLHLQEYARELIARGFDVWIVTARYDSTERYTEDFKIKYFIVNIEDEHKHLFDIADQCGISRDHIKFMNMELKSEFFRDRDFLWHLDDDQYECNDINKTTNTVAIQCNSSNWKHKCERLIKKKLNGK